MKYITLLLSLVTFLAHAEYQGSSFSEVEAIILNPSPIVDNYKQIKEVKSYQNPEKLPHYWVHSGNFTTKQEGKTIDLLAQDAHRTISEQYDYYPRLEKRLHSNGICLTGYWEITEPSEYTGYFAQGKKALTIVRASAALSNTRTDNGKRGFGLAVKLFPTENPDEVVKTANFFTIDVLLGTLAKHYLDVAMTNEPDAGFDLSNILTGFHASMALSKADKNPMYRPLYPVAELGLAPDTASKAPTWIKIQASSNMPRIDQADFRDELDIANYPDGLSFDIYVSDTTKDPKASDDWQYLGMIQLDQSVVSYGCDRQLHFAHPKIRD